MRTIFAAILWLAAAHAARAHAMLERTTPPVGSAGNPAPTELKLQFNEPVEPAFSRVTLTGPAGAVALGPPTAAADRRVLVVRPERPLGPGAYRVTWRAVSADTHVTQGDYQFRVGPKR